MVRNTPFARDFLMRWAKYYDQRPSGFSSADNGAIQLVASWVCLKKGKPVFKSSLFDKI